MKKNYIIIAVTAFVLCAVITLLGFVLFAPKGDDAAALDLSGTWMVAAYFSAGTPTLPEKDFMVFTADSVTVHKNGEVTAGSAYKLSGGTALKLTDLSKEYTIEKRTDNYIRAYENESSYIELIRYPKADMSAVSVDTSKLYGSWNVTYRNTAETITDEKLAFTAEQIDDYRNGSTEPVASSNYTWKTDSRLVAEKWGMEIQVIQLSDNTMLFIEIKSGLVWELNRAS